eukprot:4740323-Prymnesium_polylepis.1
MRNPSVDVKARPSMRPALRGKLTLKAITKELKELGGATTREGGLFAELDAEDKRARRPYARTPLENAACALARAPSATLS